MLLLFFSSHLALSKRLGPDRARCSGLSFSQLSTESQKGATEPCPFRDPTRSDQQKTLEPPSVSRMSVSHRGCNGGIFRPCAEQRPSPHVAICTAHKDSENENVKARKHKQSNLQHEV